MRRLCHVGNGRQKVWPSQLLFLTQRGKRARINQGILPVLPKGQNKLPFKAPETQRLCKRHARKTVTRPTAGMYREPGRESSWELSLYFAIISREWDTGHPMAARHSTGPCQVQIPSRVHKQTFTGKGLRQFRVSPAPLALLKSVCLPRSDKKNDYWVHNSSVAQCKRRICAPSGLNLLSQSSPR